MQFAGGGHAIRPIDGAFPIAGLITALLAGYCALSAMTWDGISWSDMEAQSRGEAPVSFNGRRLTQATPRANLGICVAARLRCRRGRYHVRRQQTDSDQMSQND